jgi:hypothetical protein
MRMGNRLLTQAAAFVVGAVVMIIATVAGHSSEQQDYEQARERSVQQVAFLSVAGGDTTGDGTSIANTLGRDIDAWLDEGRDIADFRGSNNRYGGITDALGYDPFDESGLDCSECGPLSADAQADITATREGNNLDVAFPEAPEPINWPAALGTYYLFGGAFGYLCGTISTRRRSMSFYDDLYVGVPTVCKVLAGPAYIPLEVIERMQERNHEHKLRAAFPEQMQVVDEVDRALAVLDDDDPRWDNLADMRADVMAELEAQCSSAPTSEDDLDVLMAQLQNSREFLTVRRDVLKELDRGQVQPG